METATNYNHCDCCGKDWIGSHTCLCSGTHHIPPEATINPVVNTKDMRAESAHFITLVEMEQFYTKVNGIVYWHYRLNGGEWEQRETPYHDFPVITGTVWLTKAN